MPSGGKDEIFEIFQVGGAPFAYLQSLTLFFSLLAFLPFTAPMVSKLPLTIV